MRRNVYPSLVGKARTEKQLAMHPDVAEALKPIAQTVGLVFPWKSPAQVYAWLTPLCAELGVKFTPHQARHEFASRMNEVAGATPADLVRLGTWTTTASIERYISPSDAHTRSMLAKL
jgi:integrase